MTWQCPRCKVIYDDIPDAPEDGRRFNPSLGMKFRCEHIDVKGASCPVVYQEHLAGRPGHVRVYAEKPKKFKGHMSEDYL